MPISIDEFESADGPSDLSTPKRIVAFLAANDDQAFTREEIASAIEAESNTVGTSLSRLKQRGLVRHRDTYWAITDDREAVREAYDLHSLTERLNEFDGGIDADAWDDAAPDEGHPSRRDEE